MFESFPFHCCQKNVIDSGLQSRIIAIITVFSRSLLHFENTHISSVTQYKQLEIIISPLASSYFACLRGWAFGPVSHRTCRMFASTITGSVGSPACPNGEPNPDASPSPITTLAISSSKPLLRFQPFSIDNRLGSVLKEGAL